MQFTIPVLVASSVLALSACSSSSEDPVPGGNPDSKITSHLESVGSLNNTNRMGWLLAFEDTQEQDVSIFSTFFEIDTQNSQTNPITELLSVQGDTCVVEIFSLETPLLEDQLLNDYTSVSAGEVLTLASTAGSYGEMERLEIQGGIGYLSLDGHPYPSPEMLVASVPGDTFSAASVLVEKPSAVTGLTLTENQVVQTGVTIQWAASESNDTLVKISFDSVDSADVFVSCTLIDDGEFTMPDTIFTEANTIAGTDVQLIFSGASRQRAAATRVGSDLFIAVRSVH